MAKTTKAQRKAIHAKWLLLINPVSYRNFRKRVQPTIGCDGAVAVQWCGMWLCIERDGYVHT